MTSGCENRKGMVDTKSGYCYMAKRETIWKMFLREGRLSEPVFLHFTIVQMTVRGCRKSDH